MSVFASVFASAECGQLHGWWATRSGILACGRVPALAAAGKPRSDANGRSRPGPAQMGRAHCCIVQKACLRHRSLSTMGAPPVAASTPAAAPLPPVHYGGVPTAGTSAWPSGPLSAAGPVHRSLLHPTAVRTSATVALQRALQAALSQLVAWRGGWEAVWKAGGGSMAGEQSSGGELERETKQHGWYACRVGAQKGGIKQQNGSLRYSV